MHQSRRRKKRPNYGIKTVEVIKGPNGYGFTISGQQPCILSCIVSNSPADQSGLRAGDFLISVNDVSVSKIAHDAVVSIIETCVGPIKMTIAENYYSDSSDDEQKCGRVVNIRKPKHTHKPRSRPYKLDLGKADMDSTDNSLMKMRESVLKQVTNNSRNVFNGNHAAFMNISNPNPMEDEAGPIEYKALVGYLGTIEMPKQLLPNCRLQTVCSCIRKLRQEKRTPTAVLMTILPTCLTLKDSSNHILAIYPMNRVVYVGSTSDRESRYFGLVTSAVCDTRTNEALDKQCNENSWHPVEKKVNNADNTIAISNSCHVFVTDPKIVDHNLHQKKAESFKINCTPNIVTGYCLEFPCSSLYIVSLIQNMYKLQNNDKSIENHGPVVANSPQPSASSNSDSGIGFRDDCGHISDRILVVEFPTHRPAPFFGVNNRPTGIDASNIPLEGLDMPLNNDQLFSFRQNSLTLNQQNNLSTNEDNNSDQKYLNNLSNIRACERVIKNQLETVDSKSDCLLKRNNGDEMYDNTNRLTCRVMPASNPDPNHAFNITVQAEENVLADGDVSGQGYMERPVDVPYLSPSKRGYECISLHSLTNDVDSKSGSVDNISTQSSRSNEFFNLLNIFKVPFESKKPKKQPKMSSLDNLDKYSENIMNYKLSPKVYGLSKPTYSCEDLNNFDTVDKCGYGSLQELWSFNDQQIDRNIAQSEPDVRISRNVASNLVDVLELVTSKRSFSSGDFPGAMTKYNKASFVDSFCKSYSNVILGVIYERIRDGHHMGAGLVVAMRPSFKRINSFRRSGSQRLPRRPASINAPPDVVPQFDQNVLATCSSPEGPAAWAQTFEKLLEDSLGLHMFAEFLKKEFSAENIYFWTACERFKKIPAGVEKQAEARRIYQQHLSAGSTEAVNVDSQGRQFTEQILQETNNNLFDQAQKQIFNLMKFDSYPRFLKSDIYRKCLSGEVDKTPVDARLLLHQQRKTPSKLTKSVSNAEDRRRKSLLPWHRKNRSKSRDRGESECEHRENDGTICEKSENFIGTNGRSDVYSSGSSLTSLDLVTINQDSDKLGQAPLEELSSNGSRAALCRVILSNGTTTVVKIKESETIQELVTRVLERKGLCYSSFEVLTDKHEKCLDINEPSSKLSDCEVTVEQRVVFKLDLPNRKTISIRSKYTKIIIDVLRPSLHKYQYNLDQVVVMNGKLPIDLMLPVTSIDGMRLKVLLCEGSKSGGINSSLRLNSGKVTKLEELTNKVFESILQEKSDTATFKLTNSEKGSVKSEDWGSEHSSTFIGKFLRRDSGIHDRKKKMIARCKGNSNGDEVVVCSDQCPNKKPLVAKLKAGANKLHVTRSESDELVEGLSRAQRRLEDQRGTEINIELPDFLKIKENESLGKPQKQPEVDSNSQFYTAGSALNLLPEKVSFVASAKNLKLERQSNYENRHVLVPGKSGDGGFGTSSSEEASSSNHSTPAKSSLNSTVIEKSRHGDPPPLPPKPKIVPIKPKNWGQAMFLEQTSSSFV